MPALNTKRPAMPFYIESWLAPGAARRMKPHDRGVYIDLLAYAWDKGGIPRAEVEDDCAELARTSNLSKRNFREVWSRIKSNFVLDEQRDRFVNLKQEDVRKRCELRADSLRKGKQSADKKHTDSEESRGVARRIGSPSVSDSVLSSPTEKISPVAPKGAERAADLQPDLFAVPKSVPDQPPAVESKSPKKGDANAVVDGLLEELSEARMRVRPSSMPLKPTAANRKYIAARLDDGYAPDDIRHVIAVCEAECRRYRGPDDRDPFQWFDAISPFRPDNFERKRARAAPAATVTPLHERPKRKPLPGYETSIFEQMARDQGTTLADMAREAREAHEARGARAAASCDEPGDGGAACA